MSGLLVTLPLQMACTLITPERYYSYGNVTFVQDTMSMNRSAPIPMGYKTYPDIGVAYKYYEHPLTWNMARKQCITEGGNLAVLDSFKKIGYAKELKDRVTSVHVGIHRQFNGQDWINVKTDQSLGFVPWKPDAVLTVPAQACAAMWSDGSGLSPWECNKVLPSVCEISMYREQSKDTNVECIRRPWGAPTNNETLQEGSLSIHPSNAPTTAVATE